MVNHPMGSSFFDETDPKLCLDSIDEEAVGRSLGIIRRPRSGSFLHRNLRLWPDKGFAPVQVGDE
jgi:hypothetical protein